MFHSDEDTYESHYEGDGIDVGSSTESDEDCCGCGGCSEL